MNVCEESRNFAINMLPNLEPIAAADQFVTRFLHVGLYTGLYNFLTFDLNLGVGFYSSMGLYSRQYGTCLFVKLQCHVWSLKFEHFTSTWHYYPMGVGATNYKLKIWNTKVSINNTTTNILSQKSPSFKFKFVGNHHKYVRKQYILD